MAAERTPGGFGSKLREARERRGISLRQIANATKISIGALEALERNQISRLPGGIFSRAFVRSYAIEVGLDPEETIQEFIAQFPHDSVTAGHPTSAHAEDNEALESDRRMASASLRLIAVSLPIVGVVLYYSSGRPGPPATPAPESQETIARELSSAPERAGTAEPGTSLPPGGTSATPAVDPGAARSTTAAARPQATADLLTVGVLASGPCWISAVVDGRTAIQREFAAGERQMLEVRRELILTAGDASALTWTLNGEDARPLGKAGEVVTTRVSLSNFKDYLVSR